MARRCAFDVTRARLASATPNPAIANTAHTIIGAAVLPDSALKDCGVRKATTAAAVTPDIIGVFQDRTTVESMTPEVDQRRHDPDVNRVHENGALEARAEPRVVGHGETTIEALTQPMRTL